MSRRVAPVGQEILVVRPGRVYEPAPVTELRPVGPVAEVLESGETFGALGLIRGLDGVLGARTAGSGAPPDVRVMM
jgi:hypothetical protein